LAVAKFSTTGSSFEQKSAAAVTANAMNNSDN
jgi:hypothetical protein